MNMDLKILNKIVPNWSPTTYKMDGILQASSKGHPRLTRVVQHKQINQGDAPYLQKKDKTTASQQVQKKHLITFNIINTVLHDKNSHQNGYRGNTSQHNTAYDKSIANT